MSNAAGSAAAHRIERMYKLWASITPGMMGRKPAYCGHGLANSELSLAVPGSNGGWYSREGSVRDSPFAQSENIWTLPRETDLEQGQD